MVIYLAYQFDIRNLSEPKLIGIMDDYFDFTIDNECIKDANEWLEQQRRYIEMRKLDLRILGFKGNTALDQLLYAGNVFTVRNHPTLEIRFFEEDNAVKNKYIPDKFTGLNIHAGYSGSEGIIDLIEFKPEMDAYLNSISIYYNDRLL